MELVRKLIDKQEEIKQLEEDKERESLKNKAIYTIGSSDMRVFFNGRELGTVQSIDATRENEPVHIGVQDTEVNQNERVYSRQTLREATFTVEASNINEEWYDEFYRQFIEDQIVSMSVEVPRRPNRAERRGHELPENDFRSGIKNMIGGKKRWN